MITRGELKRNTGFSSFSDFKQNIIHSSPDDLQHSYTNYFYIQPFSGLQDKRFRARLEMRMNELNNAVKKEMALAKI